MLGIAAYNAGPGNVAKWLNENEVPAAIWIENIPFGQTRHYVRKVLMYMIVYNNFVFKDKKIILVITWIIRYLISKVLENNIQILLKRIL